MAAPQPGVTSTDFAAKANGVAAKASAASSAGLANGASEAVQAQQANIELAKDAAKKMAGPTLSSSSMITSWFAQGANIHSFDPDAAPDEKARQLLKEAKASVAPIDMSNAPSVKPQELKSFEANGGSAVATDIGNNKRVQPTTDLKQVEQTNALAKDDGPEPPSVPGTMPSAKAREIPDWFKIGWSGQDRIFFETPEVQREKSILTEFVSDAYFGQWYHNAGIIVFAVIATHFITLFRGGIGWIIVILAFTATAYQVSEKRTRRNFRDDISREVAKKGLKADVESATWLNLFLQRFWLIYEPVLSATIVASVDQVLSVSTPAFLDSMRMTTFTLGTKPPHIDHVRTFADTDEDIVMMEWKISFLPNDVKDMTYAAAARKVNPKIVLNIRFGVGPASVGKDIIVEDIAFSGTMRVKIKLMNNFPHAQTVDLSFNEPPHFDFVAKPIGFDLSIIPGLIPFIHNQVHATLGPMMYAPNTFTLNLEQMLSGAPIDTAIGVLAITIRSGRGIKATKLGGGAPDPYVSVSIAGRAELAKTKIKRSTQTPSWNETKYILLNSLNDPLTLTIKDWNEHRPDSTLGSVNFDLKTMAEDAEQPGQTGEIVNEGKARGQLQYDLAFFPVLKPTKLADGTEEPVPETTTGIVRFVVHQAKELDPRGQQINPYFNVLLNDAAIHRSQTLKRTPNPIWERPAEFLVTDKSRAVIGVQVLDDNSMTADSRLGYVKVRLTDILAANAKQQDWFPLSAAKSGRLRITATWKPVLMAGAISGANSYVAPIGVVRIWLKRARDLKNVEALTGGKSDPYVRVWRAGIVAARSHVINNNLDPEWDEFVYVPIHSPRDSLSLEVLDYQHMTKDRTLGSCEISVASLVKEGPDKKTRPWDSTGRFAKKEMLKSDGKKTVKGSVEFEIEFVPCAHLKNVSFDPPKEEKLIEVEEDDDGTPSRKSVDESVKSVKKDKEEEDGITIPREKLLESKSGIVAVQIVSGQLARKGARLEVLFDDGYWPAYSTEPARSIRNTWDEIGEAMIRELEYSTIILKLNTAEKDTREDVYASTSMDMTDFLAKCLDTPATFSLSDGNGGNRSTVTLCCKFIPVDINLELRERRENSGQLTVHLLDAKGLRAADRGGKSDPYAVFELNGQRVYKSEVIKKTLSPTWNEKFECQVPSRVAANFTVEIFDWDRVGTPDKLGKAKINLSELEQDTPTDRTLTLIDKTGAEHGSVRIRMIFKAAFVARSRQATSTFSSAGRVVGGTVVGAGGAVLGAGGTVLGAGAHVVGGVGKVGLSTAGAVGKVGVGGVGAVGHGVGHVGKGLVGGVKRIGHFGQGADGQQDMTAMSASPSMASIANSSFAADASLLADQSLVSAAGAGLPGQLSITVEQLSGAGEEGEKKTVMIRTGGKNVAHTHAIKGDPVMFNETFHVKTSEGPCELEFVVVHKKAIGADKVLASSTVNVWDYINPVSMPSATVQAPLLGTGGQISLALVWTGSTADDSRSISGSVSPSTKSKSRFGRLSRSNRNSMIQEPPLPATPSS